MLRKTNKLRNRVLLNSKQKFKSIRGGLVLSLSLCLLVISWLCIIIIKITSLVQPLKRANVVRECERTCAYL